MTDKLKWTTRAIIDIQRCISEYETMGQYPTMDRLEAIIEKHCPEDKGVEKLVGIMLNICEWTVAAGCHIHPVLQNHKLTTCVHCIRVGEAKSALADYEELKK